MPAASAGYPNRVWIQIGQQHQASIKNETHDGHQHYAGGIGTLFEHAQIHHWMLSRQFAYQEDDEENDRDDDQPHDEVRGKPVILFALIERDLQRADPDGQKPDAPIVDSGFRALQIRRIENVTCWVMISDAMPTGMLM